MKKGVWPYLVVLTILSVLMVSWGCGQPSPKTAPLPATPTGVVPTPTTPTTPTTPAAPTPFPATAPEKPQHGGTFSFRIPSDILNWDPYHGGTTPQLVLEQPGVANWMGTPQDKWPFKERFVPVEFLTGSLMEKWETQDYQTITFHIRKGVRWQNKAPVTGRELTASDFEYSYNRMLGLGSGFTKPTPFVSMTSLNLIASVTAIDKYTVVFKMKEPTFSQTRMLVSDATTQYIVPRETVEKWGDFNKWDRVIGTGAFMLTDFVAGSSVTYVKNPDYWGYDEKYPENRLPYVDQVKVLIIPDLSTALAALRTGKTDMTDGINWEHAASMKKTNPALVQGNYPFMANGIYMQIDKKPFDDFKVRRALQMAIDLETIAKTFYGGVVPGKPVGLTPIKGWRPEYDDWPQDVKDGYAYNPEGAKKLLREAGYPNGFKSTLTTSSTFDIDLLQIVVGYWSVIGVDVQLAVKEPAAYTSFIRAGQAEMSSTTSVYMTRPPSLALSTRVSTSTDSLNQSHIRDPKYDEMYMKANTALNEEDEKKLIREADLYAISQQWAIHLLPTVNNNILQPWVKGGYRPDILLTGKHDTVFSRLWIDQVLKKSMGR